MLVCYANLQCSVLSNRFGKLACSLLVLDSPPLLSQSLKTQILGLFSVKMEVKILKSNLYSEDFDLGPWQADLVF